MKERPILFSGDMVRAILDGRKTQTRRVVKPRPFSVYSDAGEAFIYRTKEDREKDRPMRWPYSPGMKLWVRETWKPCFGDGSGTAFLADRIAGTPEAEGPWKPSIYLPRNRSRFTLEIVSVRVERVQDISEEDAMAEGYKASDDGITERTRQFICENTSPVSKSPQIHRFAALWNSINSKRGYGWDANPWVWVIEFKRIQECR